jgi:hypothetical protein
MIFSGSFKKAIFVSMLSHALVFSVFSLSFIKKLPIADYSRVYFWGAILNKADLVARPLPKSRGFGAEVMRRVGILKLVNPAQTKKSGYGPGTEASVAAFNSIKPNASEVFWGEKLGFIPVPASPAPSLFPKKKQAPIMLYPQLPYNFLIYFQDRQTVHIELMFNIISKDSVSAIEVKRKISSGNLEADLLSLRYINHYLFIQRPAFAPNSWQTVKIDLSTKND